MLPFIIGAAIPLVISKTVRTETKEFSLKAVAKGKELGEKAIAKGAILYHDYKEHKKNEG